VKKLFLFAAAAAALMLPMLAAVDAEASPKTRLPSSYESVQQIQLVHNEAVSATTALVNAQSLNVADNASITVAEARLPLPGRNLIVTVTEAAGATLSGTVRVECYNQFRTRTYETFTIASSGTLTGSKICTNLISVKAVSLTNEAAGDTISIGWGDKVGLPFQFSENLSEIKRIDLTVAAGTTTTNVTVNTTNVDATYYALHAAAFGGTVTDGSTVKLLVETTNNSPDDRFKER
jgi:hypothetical protein